MKQKLLKKMGLIILVASLFTSFAVMVTHMLMDTCSIKYVTFGSDIVIEEVVRGTKITLDNTITRDGYDFMGWTIGEDNDTIVSEIVVKNDTILIANWKVVEHSISYNGTEYIVYNNTVLNYKDSTISFKTVDDNLVTLCGARDYEWNISCDMEDTFVTQNMTLSYAKSKNIILSQEFCGEIYNVVIGLSDHYTINASSLDIKSGDNAIFEVVLSEGYTDSKINIIEECHYTALLVRDGVYLVTLFDVHKDMHITIGGVEKNTYTVLLDYDGGVESRCLNEIVLKHGERLYLPTPKKQGYSFNYWIDTKTNIIIDTPDIAVVSNIKLKAVYELEKYVITLPISNNGSFITTYDKAVVTIKNQECKVTTLDSITFTVSLSEMYDINSLELYYMLNDTKVVLPHNIHDSIASVTISGALCNMAVQVDSLKIRTYSVCVDYAGGVDEKLNEKISITLHYGSLIMVENDTLKLIDYIDGVTTEINGVTKLGSIFSNYSCDDKMLTNLSIQSLSKERINIYIEWEMVESTITLYSNGGMFADGKTKCVMLSYNYSEDIVPTKLGYKFVGWFTKLIEINGEIDYTLSIKLDLSCVDNNIEAYAGWVLEA